MLTKEPFKEKPPQAQETKAAEKCEAKTDAAVKANEPPPPKTESELFDSWFGKSGTSEESSKSLDGFFKETDVKKEAEEATKCVIPPKRDPSYPESSTCDPGLEKLHPAAFQKPIKANCGLSQDKKNIMMITEYENENAMNGGKLFMNLDAYEDDKSTFASYACVN